MDISLPDGYQFAERQSIAVEEVSLIQTSVGWLTSDPERWQKCLDDSISVCGVRSSDGNLVGIGFIAGSLRHAVLCDFGVLKEHQNRGIGKAILQKRLALAGELSIPYLYVSLSETNHLRSFYEQFGFKGGSDLLFFKLARRR